MSINSNYLFVVNMDVDADKEALFNEIYDNEHIPNLLKVPGVRGVTRMAGARFAAVPLADFAADFFVVFFAVAMIVLPIVAADFPMHIG
jgi:hypothetical protein